MRMRMMVSVLAVSWLMPSSLLGQLPVVEGEIADLVREMTASQATAELALYHDDVPNPVLARYVQVVSMPSQGTYAILRARIQSIPHWHLYSFIVIDSAPVPVGGFDSRAFGGALNGQVFPNKDRTIASIAEELVAGAESRYGIPYVVGSTHDVWSAPDSVLSLWARARPPEWPSSARDSLPSGETLVRITALRPSVQNPSQKFTPVAYSFVFSAAGRIVASAFREGLPF